MILKCLLFGIGVFIEPFLRFFKRVFNSLFILLLNLLAILLRVFNRVLHRINIALQGILCVYSLLSNSIRFLELLCLFEHLFNFLFAQSSLVICDDYLFLLASALILGLHLQNTIRIYFKGDFYLWHTSRGRWDSGEIEFAKEMVILCQWSLSFKHLNSHRFLIILISSKHLTLLGWNERPFRNNLRHHSSNGFNTKS